MAISRLLASLSAASLASRKARRRAVLAAAACFSSSSGGIAFTCIYFAILNASLLTTALSPQGSVWTAIKW
jgi:hypothetical protein